MARKTQGTETHSHSHSHLETIIQEKYSNRELRQDKPDKEDLTTNNLKDAVYPMDTGYAWVVLAAATLNVAMIFGAFNAFGAFQEYYVNTMFPDVPAATVSWIGTISYCVVLSGGIFASPVISYIGFRNASVMGSLVGSVGLFASSFCNSVPTLALTQGFIYSIGSAIVINCSAIAPSLWFDKKKGVAFSVVFCAGGFGSLVLVPIINITVEHLGIHRSFQILGLLNLAVTLVSSSLLRINGEYKPLRTLLKMSLLKDKYTLFLCAAALFFEAGYNVVALYLSATIRELGQARSFSTNMIMIFALFGGIGRLVSFKIADRIGVLNTIVLSSLIAGAVSLTMWLPTKNLVVYIAYIAIFGFNSALFFPLSPLLVDKHFKREEISQVTGLVYMFLGIGTLVGTPLMGLMFDKVGHRESYDSLKVLCGVMYILAGLVFYGLKIYTQKYLIASKSWKL